MSEAHRALGPLPEQEPAAVLQQAGFHPSAER